MTWFMVEAVGIILAAFFLPYGIKFLAETKIRLRSSGIVLYYLCHKTATPTQPDTTMTDLEIIQNEITEQVAAFMLNNDKMKAVYMTAQNLFGLTREQFEKDNELRMAMIAYFAMNYPESK